MTDDVSREDDTNWPKKNIVGKQELEVRVGNDHIAFEVHVSMTLNTSSALILWNLSDCKNRLFSRYPG